MRAMTRRTVVRGAFVAWAAALAPVVAACGPGAPATPQPTTAPIPPAPQPPAPVAAPKAEAPAPTVAPTAAAAPAAAASATAAPAATKPAAAPTGDRRETMVFLVPNFAPLSWPVPRGAA